MKRALVFVLTALVNGLGRMTRWWIGVSLRFLKGGRK